MDSGPARKSAHPGMTNVEFIRHCERSEAIQERRALSFWIASSLHSSQ